MTDAAGQTARAAAALEQWRAVDGADNLSSRSLGVLGRVFACSDYLRQQCLRHPGRLLELDRSGTLHRRRSTEDYRRLIRAALDGDTPETPAAQLRCLRQARHLELLRLAWRDLAGWADIDETLAGLSATADALIEVAADWAQAEVAKRFGILRAADGTPQRLIVVAMGKLGGGELNFSSDVDLVFLYPRSGVSDGPRELDSERYFARVGQKLIELLDKTTEQGFVYRVDMRLRPFGNSGALALSYAAFETYLLQHGREWERYAYVKARPVTGAEPARREFAELVRPFVYRRYLDFGVLESLREMKALIAADVERRSRRDDVKLGPGGIREIEFIVQSFQMLRGGALPSLRQPNLLTVLPQLDRRQWLTPAAAIELAQAYRFLRRAENYLQMWRDQQVHTLPVDEEGRDRLACAMGTADWAGFANDLAHHRDAVTRHFERTVAEDGGGDARADVLEAIWRNDPGADSARVEFEALGYVDAAGLQRTLRALRRSTQYRRLDQRGRERLDILVPRIVRIAARTPQPDEVARRLLRIVAAVGARSAYFALLNENPAVLDRLAELSGSSPWVSRRVAERPILLDELIDPRLFEIPPARADFVTELAQRFAAVAADDLERQMDALREFQQASVFRVAVADLAGVLPLMKVSDRLTEIAELVLEKVVELAERDIVQRYGQPQCGEAGRLRRPGLAIIGYGKLGGLELGYASDLDIVLIHDSAGSVHETDGDPPLDNTRYFSRVGQRVLHMLATATLSGVLYEVDTRLRPSGKAGPLVSSLEAFARYQRASAWTWEHQALLRARGVAGAREVIAGFEALRTDVLTEPQDADLLRERVIEMRERMRRELKGGGPGQFDIKRDSGGLTDIEFMVQYLVLGQAAAHPQLVQYSDNIRQLEALAQVGLVQVSEAEELADIYRRFRQRLHRLALADRPGLVEEPEFDAERDAVRAYWDIVFTP